MALYKANVVRLHAGGYDITQFGMSDKEREALVNAGREAMRAFLPKPSAEDAALPASSFEISDPMAQNYANDAASNLLGQ